MTRHRARTNPLGVRPVVVVWGGMQSEVPSPTHVNGIDVVPGRDVLGWLESLEGHSVSRDAAEEFLQRLRAWVAQRNPSKRVVPPIAATT